MKKKWLALFLAVTLLASGAACTPGTKEIPPKETPDQKESTPLEADEETLAMFEKLYANAKRVESFWYSGNVPEMELDLSVDPITDEMGDWYPVITFNTLEELKKETENYYSKEYAQLLLYDSPYYKEMDGKLYLLVYDPSPTTYPTEKLGVLKVISKSDSEIKVSADLQGKITDGITEKNVYTLIPKGNDWVIANSVFIVDSLSFTDEMKAQLEELTESLQQAQQPTSTATEELEKAVDKEKVILEDLGYLVSTYPRGSTSADRLKAFFAGDDQGYSEILYLNAYDNLQLEVEFYVREGEELYMLSAYIVPDFLGNYYYSVGNYESILESGEVTPRGNLILKHKASPDRETLEPYFSGFLLEGQSEEFYQAEHTYVCPINCFYGIQLRNNWEESNSYEGIIWPYLLEELWSYQVTDDSFLFDEAGEFTVMEEISEYEHLVKAVVPAEIVENIITQYFDISSADIKVLMINEEGVPLYDAATDSYTFVPLREDYQPAIVVWDVVENDDKTISITLAVTGIEEGNDGKELSVLTVKPQEDGSFRYLSNQLL